MSFGNVKINGRDIGGHTPPENLGDGFCFAYSALFSISVQGNVMYQYICISLQPSCRTYVEVIVDKLSVTDENETPRS